jgi:ectoine hydroxylase
LLGGDVYIHQSRINYKSGFSGKEFYWHSDFETWHVEDGVPAMRMLSFSITLTPNTACNGPLMIIPGSHRQFLSCVGATPENNHVRSLRRQEIGVPDEENLSRLVEENGIVAPTGGIGSVTVFECNALHGSNSNITPLARSNVFIVYNSVENTPVEPFCGLPPRPAYIAEREDFTPAGRLR